MVQTYTSNEIAVSDGEITSHDTSKDREINILDAEVRWQGVNTTEEETVYDENTSINTDIAQSVSTSIPNSVPDGYSFFNTEGYFTLYNTTDTEKTVEHTYSLEDDSGEIVRTDTHTIPQYGTRGNGLSTTFNYLGGTARSEITNNVTGIEITVEAIAEGEKTVTNTYSTQDPYVTRDVDGSYTGTLDDGEWSTWQTLNGLEANANNEFYHNISGSNEAVFQFRYDWEHSYPDSAGGYLSIYDEATDTIYRIAVADTADDLLDYDAARVSVNGTTYAIDVVAEGDGAAVDEAHIYHPTHGILHPRESYSDTL